MTRSSLLLKIVVGLILMFTMAPILTVMATSFTTTAYPVFPPRGFTLRWFGQFLDSDEFMAATRISFVVALCTAVLASALGTAAALALTRADLPARSAISTLMMAPAVFPAIVLGVAILIFYHVVGGAGTLPGIVAAHVLVTTPFVIRMVLASLARLDPTLGEAARNLGGSNVRVFLRITLPLVRPGIVAGALCAFLLSFDELVITLFISGPGTQSAADADGTRARIP